MMIDTKNEAALHVDGGRIVWMRKSAEGVDTTDSSAVPTYGISFQLCDYGQIYVYYSSELRRDEAYADILNQLCK